MRKLLTSSNLCYKSELRNLLIAMVLLNTGIRNSELVRIKLEDIQKKEVTTYKLLRQVLFAPCTIRKKQREYIMFIGAKF